MTTSTVPTPAAGAADTSRTGLVMSGVSLELGDGDRIVRALDSVDLVVRPGELVAVVGPSGAGKSSLLAVAGALTSPTSGTATVHGHDLASLSARRRARFRLEQIGFVFQSGNLVPALTVADQLRLHPRTLQRRLAGEGVTFAALLDRERRAQAARLLTQPDLQLGQVAGLLGYSEQSAFNRAFHLALIRPAGQSITTQLLERLHVLSDRYVRKHLEPLGRDQRASEEHAEILRLWLARDSKAVAKSMHVHIKKTITDLRRQLTSNGG